jgi:hypothetical protein
MPALPGTHLVFVHPRLTFASFETGFNADASFDYTRQLASDGSSNSTSDTPVGVK